MADRAGISARGVRAESEGYALLAVLWICAGVAGLGMIVSVSARHAATASRNRIALTRAEWQAENCLARARSAIATALREEATRLYRPRVPAWGRADRILANSWMTAEPNCELAVRAVGGRIDVNTADDSTLARLFRLAGMPTGRADSTAAAISDWRDTGDAPRPLGAERDWYEARDQVPPSNRDVRSLRELQLIRGINSSHGIDALLDVEPGAVSINVAPREILSVLPGFTSEAVTWVERRRGGTPFRTFEEIGGGLSASARATFMEALPRLAAAATLDPTAWVVAARSDAGNPSVAFVIELRLERAGASTEIVRRRTWIP